MKVQPNLIILLLYCLVGCKDDNTEPDLPKTELTNTEKTYGGIDEDFFESIIELNGFLYQFGSTLSKGDINGDLYLVKTDLNGEKLWEKTFGLTGIERGNQVLATDDGNLYLLGSTESISNGRADVYLLKVDTSGNKIWEKNYGTIDHEIPSRIIQTSNNELCIAATQYLGTKSNIYLVWTDLEGNFIKDKSINTTATQGSSSILEAVNKDLYIFGYTQLGGPITRNFYLLKTNQNGDSIWAKSYGGLDYEESSTFLKTPNNNFLLIGHTASTDPLHNMYAVKVDVDGNVIWEKNYGGFSHDGAEGGIVNSDGNYVFLGISNSFGNRTESILIITANKNGIQISEDVVTNNFGQRGDDLIQLNDYYYITGRSKEITDGNNFAGFFRRIK